MAGSERTGSPIALSNSFRSLIVSTIEVRRSPDYGE